MQKENIPERSPTQQILFFISMLSTCIMVGGVFIYAAIENYINRKEMRVKKLMKLIKEINDQILDKTKLERMRKEIVDDMISGDKELFNRFMMAIKANKNTRLIISLLVKRILALKNVVRS